MFDLITNVLVTNDEFRLNTNSFSALIPVNTNCKMATSFASSVGYVCEEDKVVNTRSFLRSYLTSYLKV